jgi:hypothetical protein
MTFPPATPLSEAEILTAVNSSPAAVPVGSVITLPTALAPLGFILCRGQLLDRDLYPELFAEINTDYGTTLPTNFRVPDYRGEFLRGMAAGSSRDPNRSSRTNASLDGGGATGDNVGTRQGHMYQSHTHDQLVRLVFGAGGALRGGGARITEVDDTGARGGSETRGRNVYVNYAIRAY